MATSRYTKVWTNKSVNCNPNGESMDRMANIISTAIGTSGFTVARYSSILGRSKTIMAVSPAEDGINYSYMKIIKKAAGESGVPYRIQVESWLHQDPNKDVSKLWIVAEGINLEDIADKASQFLEEDAAKIERTVDRFLIDRRVK